MEAHRTDPTVPDSTTRFSDRVEQYVKYRPGYPSGVLAFLRELGVLWEGATIADIGSGTGISSTLLLSEGHEVFAVEPNGPMRQAAERMLKGDPHFHSVNGKAEATTLADASVDLIIAGQAFHWFDPSAARREFARILRPGGGVALFWNCRILSGTPFADQYEALSCEFGTDYCRVRHEELTAEQIAAFLSPGKVQIGQFPNAQRLDYAALEGRLLSSSYIPGPTKPRYPEMIVALRKLFDHCQIDGHVVMEYTTEVHAARFTGENNESMSISQFDLLPDAARH